MKKTVKVLAFALTFIMLAMALTACAPKSDPDKALKALKDKEYSAVKSDYLGALGLAALGIKGVDSVVSGTKTVEKKDEEKTESVTIIYFSSKDAAKDAWEKVEDYAKDQNKDKDTDWQVKKSGAMIYFGTKAGIKAAS